MNRLVDWLTELGNPPGISGDRFAESLRDRVDSGEVADSWMGGCGRGDDATGIDRHLGP